MVVADDAGGRGILPALIGTLLADVEQGGLVVQHHELRPGQNVDAALRLEGPHQHAQEVALHRVDEAADVLRRRDLADAQVGDSLHADVRRADQRIIAERRKGRC